MSTFFSRNLIISFLLSLITLLGIVIMIPMRFETIDDFFMSAIASGFIGGNPDEHLIYSNFIIGLGLKFLYGLVPGIAWYGVYLFLSHCIAWTIILFVFLEFIERKFAIWIFIYLIIVFEVYFLQNFQFTTSTALLSSAGMLLLFRNITHFGFNFKHLILPFIIVVFASLMRMHSAVLSVILFSPLFLIFLPDFKKLLKSALVVGILFAVCNMSMPLDKWYYNLSDKWGDYYDHFYESAIFNDDSSFYIAHLINPEKPYKDFGWSDNDLAVFTSFFRDYPPVFNSSAYANLHVAMDKVAFDKKAFINNLFSKFRNIHLLVVLLFCLIFVKSFRLLIPFAILTLTVAIVGYVLIRFQLKERVLFSILFTQITIFLFLIFKEYKEGRTRKINFLPSSLKPYYIVVFPVLLSLLALNTFRNTFTKGNKANLEAKQLLKSQLALISDCKLIAVFGSSIKFEAESPFINRFNHEQNPRIYPISAFSRSPLLYDFLDEYKVSNFPELLLKKDITIACQTSELYGSGPEYLKTFYNEHFRCDPILNDYESDEKANLLLYSFSGCKKY